MKVPTPVPPLATATVPVTLAAVPPIERDDVATSRKAVPAALLYIILLPETDEKPVPPPPIVRVPERDGVAVRFWPEPTKVMADVRPLVTEVLVATTTAPVIVWFSGPMERTPVFVTAPFAYARPPEKVVVDVQVGTPFRRARTLPAVPEVVVERAEEPLPYGMEPACIAAQPVPPLATFKVPVSVRVPEVVTGEPVKERPVVPPDPATDVTVPLVRDERHWVVPVIHILVASIPPEKVEVAVDVAWMNGTFRYDHADMPRARMSPLYVVVPVFEKSDVPATVMLFRVAVPVANTLAVETLPEKRPLPWTDNICDGEVVPRPSLPSAVTVNTVDVASPAVVGVSMENRGILVTEEVAEIMRRAVGEVVPTPTKPPRVPRYALPVDVMAVVEAYGSCEAMVVVAM